MNSNFTGARFLRLAALLASCTAAQSRASAQERITVRMCGSSDRYQQLIKRPEFAVVMKHADEETAKVFGLLNTSTPPVFNPLTIKVVVHVLYRAANGNAPVVGEIAEDQIVSQIEALNRDYNPPVSAQLVPLVPLRFRNVFGFPELTFVLDHWDSKQTTAATFTNSDNAKQEPDGVFPDDPVHKLNIWVVPALRDRNGTQILGYSSWPGEPKELDGVVINYQAFGTKGTAVAPFNLGHTTTHEVGHWLNLHHLWGDHADNLDCSQDDGIAQTARQSRATQTCPKPSNIVNACDGNRDGAMFPNFMDYTLDACMSMFTTEQVVHMRTTLTNLRPQVGQ